MSPETIARSVQRLNAAGVAWPTTHRVAVTVRLAGLADVIALGDGVLDGPAAARAAFGHVLRAVGTDPDPAGALREISKVQRVLSVMEPPAAPSAPEVVPGPVPAQDPPPASAPPAEAAGVPASPTHEPPGPPGPRPLPVRPVRRAGTDGPA